MFVAAFTVFHLISFYMCLCSRTTWVSWYQKGKPLWVIIKQEIMG